MKSRPIAGKDLDMLENFFTSISIRTIIDVVIVAYLFYKIYQMIKETRAVQLLKGLGVFFALAYVANVFQLNTVSWLFTQLQTVLFVAIPIIFQPELRRALEKIGQGKFFSKEVENEEAVAHMIDEICDAIFAMSRQQIGVLLVLEREVGLADHVDTGTIINGEISSQLLQNIFFPKASMHDGATIIKENKVYAAGCILPLTEDISISKSLGTRHRAAVGLSEVSDAFIIVVSEETGAVSSVENGRMNRYLDEATLKNMLVDRFKIKKKFSLSESITNIFQKGGHK